MKKLLLIGYKKPWLTLLSIVSITLAALYPASRVHFDVTGDGLMPDSSPELDQYQKVRQTFGSDEIAGVYISDFRLTSREKLVKLGNLHKALQKLSSVQRIESLFSLPDVKLDEGWIDFSSLLHPLPESQEIINQKIDDALTNPIFLRNVISPDAQATMLVVYLEDEEKYKESRQETYNQIAAALKDYEQYFEKIYQVGGPALEVQIYDFIKNDQLVILSLSVLALFILLALMQRSWVAGLIPLVNAGFATVWTLGAMSLLGVPVNMLNYIFPVLVLIIGATEDVHLIHEFRTQAGKKPLDKHSIELMKAVSDRMMLALLLTAITTIFGFSATGISSLGVLQDFGFATSAGMVARFVMTVFLVPALLKLWQPRARSSSKSSENQENKTKSSFIAEWIVRFMLPRPYLLLLVVTVTMISTFYFIPKIHMSNDLMSFVGEDTLLVKQVNEAAERLSGTKVLYLTLYGEEGDFRKPEELRRVERLTEYLRKLPEVNSVTSFTDFIGRTHERLNEKPELTMSYSRLPNKASTLEQYLLFFNSGDLQRYVSGDFSKLNLTIRCHENDSSRLREFANELREVIGNGSFGSIHFTLTGKALIVAEAVDSVIWTQVVSLGSMAVLLFFISSGLFLSFRCGLSSLLTNSVPVAAVFGIMGGAGIPLNVGTCMVAAVTLGIAIDDTLHLLVRFNRKLTDLKSEKAAVKAALEKEMGPVVATSIALAGGFMVLSLASFEPVRQFGYLSAIVILLALVTDLLLTPVLFGSMRLVTLWDVLDLKLRKALILRSPFFKGLTSWQAKRLILVSDLEEYKAGTQIIKTGDTGDKMYVVLSGRLQVSKPGPEGAIRLATLRMGDVFGETAVIAQCLRTADIIADTDIRLLMLDREALGRLRKFSPFLASQIFLNLTSILGRRLADTSERLRQITA
ncbi:MAG: MMPL family transporter [Verrucomicrobiota bacterium]